MEDTFVETSVVGVGFVTGIGDDTSSLEHPLAVGNVVAIKKINISSLRTQLMI